MIYAVKRRLESGDPSDSLSSVEAEACKRHNSSQETLKASIIAAWANISMDYSCAPNRGVVQIRVLEGKYHEV